MGAEFRFEPAQHLAGECMQICGAWGPEAAAAFAARRPSALCLSRYNGWRDRDLRLLGDVPAGSLLGIEIYARGEKIDLSPLAIHPGVQLLSLYCDSPSKLEFAQFRSLQTLNVEWKKHFTLGACRELSKANIWKPPQSSLSMFSECENLQDLMVQSSRKLTSLEGLPGGLRKLTVYDCKKVDSLEPLARIQGLEKLMLDEFHSAYSLEPLRGLRHLVDLRLLDCGEVASLRPVAGHRLEVLATGGSTKVLDGDLEFFRAMPSLQKFLIRHWPHYSSRAEDILAR